MFNKKILCTLIFTLCLTTVNTQNAQHDELISSIVETYELLNSWEDDYREKVNKLDDLLVRFFQTESSLSFDMKTVLPFSSLISSGDGKIRVFSWFTENGGQAWEYHSLIQYKINNGGLKAGLLSKIFGAKIQPNDPWYGVPTVEYNSIAILNRDIYLLFGGARNSSSGTILYCFLALELKDIPLPCSVFDGKAYLYFVNPAVQPPHIEELPGFIDLKSNFPNDFTLLYAKPNSTGGIITEEYQFKFDGEKFEGDYSIFKYYR